jgi:hypothetical protein
MFRSGVTVGTNGPTGFLLKGKKRRPGYTDEMLVKHGCEEGSTIVMTENAFMTNDAWIELTKKVSCFARRRWGSSAPNPAAFVV